MQTQIEIKKAKITKEGMDIDYEEVITLSKDVTVRTEVSKKCWYQPHNDLLTAFDDLRIHLIQVCEQEKKFNPLTGDLKGILSGYRATGFVIGGAGEHEGVCLIGCKKLKHNKKLPLTPPFVKWQDEHTGYFDSLELRGLIRICSEEVIKYLNGKMSAEKQPELNFSEAAEEMA